MLKSVLVATPCYGGQLTIGYFRSAMAIRDLCAERQIDCNFLVTEGESLVTRARNNLVATFMQTEYQTLAFIDADVEIAAKDFLKLLELDGIRGAAVNMKRPDFAECLACFAEGGQSKRADMPAEPFPVQYLGSAVLFMDRPELERLYYEYPDRAYEDEIVGPGIALFEQIIVDETYLSEDFGFCQLLHEQKIPIICHPDVIVTHYGSAGWRA